ncbi:MAG TPA: ATP-binding protein [Aggregatilineales bacterium]|nr:ATP-binding protein [Aggregatilineales bacterium]
MQSVGRDITERKRTEEEIRKLNEELEQRVLERTEELAAEKQQTETILHHVADAIMFTDIEGNILYTNPAWEKVTGYTFDEVRGRNLHFLQTGRTPRTTYMELWRTIRSGETWTGLFFNKRKDQVEYDSQATISPVRDAHGEISHFVEVHRDVTEERELAAMGEEFIANTAHDLNNPLTVLYTSLHLLKANPAQLEKRLAVFEHEIFRLMSLVDDLLTISRVKRQPATEFQTINLNTLVARNVDIQTDIARSKEITLSFNPTDSLPEIFAHPHFLDRVIINLVANAINYTPSGGSVQVTTELTDSFVVMTIEDTGIGIAADELPHIFERFYRSDTARQTANGTGLGLPIVREIVELHEGRIDVQSTPGEGTVFRVSLPIESSLSRDESAVTPPQTSFQE